MPTKPNKSTQSTGSKTEKIRGNMKPGEIRPLVMAASKAFHLQKEYGNISDTTTFDDWRHEQCLQAVGKPGITACDHVHFRPLIAHFQTLSGDDAGAFASLMQTGPASDHAAPGDTHEERRILADNIGTALAAHMHLATTPEPMLLAEAVEVMAIFQPGLPWENSTGPAAFLKMMARRAAIEAKGKGPITVGYVVYLVRQKTRRPDLTLGHDWQAGLAERCTAKQLDQIRSTLVNRIAAVEGIGSSRDRNKSQRSTEAKVARDPKQITPRW